MWCWSPHLLLPGRPGFSMYLITNTNHCAQPPMGAEEPFGESPPPLETINKAPSGARSFTHAPLAPPGASRLGKPRLSPRPCQTWGLAGQTWSLSFPPPADERRSGRARPAAPTADAGQPAARGSARGSGVPSTGVPAPSPPPPPKAIATDVRRAPRRPDKRRVQRVTARQPPTQRGSRPGGRVCALVPAPRAGSHPPAGVCASVHRNASGGGACGSRAAGAGRGGPEGRRAGARRPERGAAKASGAGKGPAGSAAGGGAGASLARPPRAPLRAPRARRARLRARGAGRGRGGAGRGAGARTPGSSLHRKRAVVGETHRKCVTTPPTTRTELAVVAARRRPTDPCAAHARALLTLGTCQSDR
jgi:hypothetical protein